jgi:glycosyltransferase involved in cell wall biosynthesis
MLTGNETLRWVVVRVCYVVLSPTFGMQQYTAGLVNQMADAFENAPTDAWHLTVITHRRAPCDRYAPQIEVQALVDIAGTGLQKTNFSLRGLESVYRAIRAARPDVVHFTGPHIWNPVLLLRLKQAGIKTIHTIHDLDPHSGAGYGRLLYIWNNSILRWADHILVHGQVYRQRLVQRGLGQTRVSYTPLLHLFLSYEAEAALRETRPAVTMEPFVLFFARIEAYKGIDTLFEAMRLNGRCGVRAIVAGKGELEQAAPENVEVRNRLMGDAEAIDLFSRCSLVVLPYHDATQSALIGAAYFFGKPVIVTRTGALPEYVDEGVTGWIIEPGDAAALAERVGAVSREPKQLQQMGQAGQAWYEAQYRDARPTLRNMYERVAA